MQRLISGLSRPIAARCGGLTQFVGRSFAGEQPRFSRGDAGAQPLAQVTDDTLQIAERLLQGCSRREWTTRECGGKLIADLGSGNDPKGVQEWRRLDHLGALYGPRGLAAEPRPRTV
jgi:hypothetical protein